MYATPQAQPPTVVIPLAPATFVVIDLETGDAPAEAVEQALAGWTPPGNLKDPVKIDARRAEAVEKIRERAALLDASPILCVALQTDRARLIFNGMDHAAPDIDGWPVRPCS